MPKGYDGNYDPSRKPISGTATFPDDEANRAEDARILAERAKADPANANPARTSKPRKAENREPAPTPSRRARLRGGAKRAASRPIGKRSSRGPRKPSLTNPTGGRSPVQIGHSFAGVILGGIIYANVLAVVKYGASGPKMWFEAKFLNDTTGASSSSKTPSYTTPAPGSSGSSSSGASPWYTGPGSNAQTPLPTNVPGTIF